MNQKAGYRHIHQSSSFSSYETDPVGKNVLSAKNCNYFKSCAISHFVRLWGYVLLFSEGKCLVVKVQFPFILFCHCFLKLKQQNSALYPKQTHQDFERFFVTVATQKA